MPTVSLWRIMHRRWDFKDKTFHDLKTYRGFGLLSLTKLSNSNKIRFYLVIYIITWNAQNSISKVLDR